MSQGRVAPSIFLGATARSTTASTYLLHDTSLALGEGDVTTRLILDKLDLDLAALTTRLVIVVVVVLSAHAAALGTAGVSAVAGLLQVIVVWRELLLTDRGHIGHLGSESKGDGMKREEGKW